jgi:hypothetical protein
VYDVTQPQLQQRFRPGDPVKYEYLNPDGSSAWELSTIERVDFAHPKIKVITIATGQTVALDSDGYSPKIAPPF